MKILLIILFVATSIMWSLYKRFQRTVVETESERESDEQTYDEQIPAEEVENISSPYFSYEYEVPAEKPVVKEHKPQPVAVNVQPAVANEKNNGFDLRQAVIYQTVLSNPYIDEINQ